MKVGGPPRRALPGLLRCATRGFENAGPVFLQYLAIEIHQTAKRGIVVVEVVAPASEQCSTVRAVVQVVPALAVVEATQIRTAVTAKVSIHWLIHRLYLHVVS